MPVDGISSHSIFTRKNIFAKK